MDPFGYSDFQFKKHNQFVSISLSKIPQDQDLGIGVTLWTNDNYSTRLNFVVQYLTQAHAPKVYDFYSSSVEKNIADIQSDLELYLGDYLQGDLKTYAFVAGVGMGQR